MIAREAGAGDLDWWMAHVLIAIFGVLVAAILRAVPGWSAPLHVWIALAGGVIALLAAHAGIRAGALALRRRGRDAFVALLLAAALGVAATALVKYGRAHAVTLEDAPIDDTPATVTR